MSMTLVFPASDAEVAVHAKPLGNSGGENLHTSIHTYRAVTT